MAAAAATVAWASDEPPADLAALESRLQTACRSQDYAKALDIAESVHELMEPRHIETLYSIACLHCLLGDRDQAYAWLQKALDAGYWDFRHVMEEAGWPLPIQHSWPNKPEARTKLRLAGAEPVGIGYVVRRDAPTDTARR
jgi:tetratricopeptide (TPR) repeat protein